MITRFYQYRKLLKKCLNNHNIAQEFSIDQITSLELHSLKNNNILVLILDYDGVLSAQDQVIPGAEVISWLEKALLIFGPKKIFILSNNPLLSRQEFFNEYFNNQIIFVVTTPKPDPNGIAEIYAELQLGPDPVPEKSQILMIDDRLSTGILAAKIFGIASCLILKPYTNIKKRFIIESYFILIRKLERFIIWHL